MELPWEVGVYFEKVCIYLICHGSGSGVFIPNILQNVCRHVDVPRVILPCMYDLFHRDPDQEGSPDRTTVSRKFIHVKDLKRKSHFLWK